MKGRESIVFGVAAILGLGLAGGSSPSQPQSTYRPLQQIDPNAWAHLEGLDAAKAMEREFDRVFPERAQARKFAAEMPKRMQEQMKQERAKATEEANRQSLGATDAQWRTMQPRLEALNRLSSRASAFILLQRRFLQGSTRRINGVEQKEGPACQWRWERPSEDKGWEQLNPAERTCEELLDLLSDEQAPLEQIWEKVELLRKQKREAAAQVPAARAELRKVVDVRQEAILTIRGLLK